MLEGCTAEQVGDASIKPDYNERGLVLGEGTTPNVTKLPIKDFVPRKFCIFYWYALLMTDVQSYNQIKSGC